jgi:hypothetical protein
LHPANSNTNEKLKQNKDNFLIIKYFSVKTIVPLFTKEQNVFQKSMVQKPKTFFCPKTKIADCSVAY